MGVIVIVGTPVKTREFYHPFVTGGTKEVYFLKTKLYKHTNLNVTRELASCNKSWLFHIETCRQLISF